MAYLPLAYEIPIFIFIALAFYTIYRLNEVRKYLAEGALRSSFSWFVASSILFSLWAIVHVVGDFFGSESLEPILHYGVSHMFLVISMFCIAIAANKIRGAYKELAKKLGMDKKEK